MLVLSRKRNETVVIAGNIRVTVIATDGNRVRLGIDAPERVGIYREELCPPEGAAEGRGVRPSVIGTTGPVDSPEV